MRPRLEPTPDDPSTVALLHGPLVLAADLGPVGGCLRRPRPCAGRRRSAFIDRRDRRGAGEIRDARHRRSRRSSSSRPSSASTTAARPSTSGATRRPNGRRRSLSRAAEQRARHGTRRTLDRHHPARCRGRRAPARARERISYAVSYRFRPGRDARTGGFLEFDAAVREEPLVLRATYWGGERDRVFHILVDGERIATQRLQGEHPGEFIERDYVLPWTPAGWQEARAGPLRAGAGPHGRPGVRVPDPRPRSGGPRMTRLQGLYCRALTPDQPMPGYRGKNMKTMKTGASCSRPACACSPARRHRRRTKPPSAISTRPTRIAIFRSRSGPTRSSTRCRSRCWTLPSRMARSTTYSYLGHQTGGQWRRASVHGAGSVQALLDAQKKMGDQQDADEKNKKLGAESNAICPSHDDYIWRAVAGNIGTVGRGGAAFSTYYVCDQSAGVTGRRPREGHARSRLRQDGRRRQAEVLGLARAHRRRQVTGASRPSAPPTSGRSWRRAPRSSKPWTTTRAATLLTVDLR